MEVKEALLARRSVRKYTSEPVSDNDINELLIAGMSGPSAVNRQPWEFYVVTNPDKLEELRHTTPFTKGMKAPLAIIVCGNLKRSLPAKFSTYWIQDCSAAIENILLRVTDLGLGAVWCGLHPQKSSEEKVRKMLGIPEKQIPLGLIFIGHPDEAPAPRTQLDMDKVHYIK